MKLKKVSILIPAYNEENTIIQVLQKVTESIPHIQKEIIVVNDCSTDTTREQLSKHKHLTTKIVHHENNKGKGASLQTAMKHATGDIIIIQDADLEYNPSEYERLIEPILQQKSTVVYGSRFLQQPTLGKQKWAIPTHYIGNKILSLITSILYLQKITDMETGHKAFTKEALQGITITSERFDFEPEITSKIIKKGIRIHEIPIQYNARTKKEGKKITWKDGIHAIKTLVYWRFKK